MRKLYIVTRDLHLYVGFFISPFVVVFAVSVLFLVHAYIPGVGSASVATREVRNLAIPPNLESLAGRERAAALHRILDAAGVSGEIRIVRHFPKTHGFEAQFVAPGRETVVRLDIPSRTATVRATTTGAWDALVTLHKLPGPHLADVRGNWFYMRVWAWLADATVYGILFVTISGLYLWWALRAEHRIGAILLSAGALSFFTVVYALSH